MDAARGRPVRLRAGGLGRANIEPELVDTSLLVLVTTTEQSKYPSIPPHFFSGYETVSKTTQTSLPSPSPFRPFRKDLTTGSLGRSNSVVSASGRISVIVRSTESLDGATRSLSARRLNPNALGNGFMSARAKGFRNDTYRRIEGRMRVGIFIEYLDDGGNDLAVGWRFQGHYMS